jgi:hypothetical protein
VLRWSLRMLQQKMDESYALISHLDSLIAGKEDHALRGFGVPLEHFVLLDQSAFHLSTVGSVLYGQGFAIVK